MLTTQPAGNRAVWAAAIRVMKSAWYGEDVTGIAKPPDLLNGEFLSSTSADGTTLVNIIGVNSANQVVVLGGVQNTVVVTETLAQVKAGTTFLAGMTGRTITPVGFRIKFTGTFTTSTTIRISTTDAVPVDIATVAIANATDGNILTSAGGTGLTIGAGFGVPSTAGVGIQIRDVTAGTSAGGTSIDIKIDYLVN